MTSSCLFLQLLPDTQDSLACHVPLSASLCDLYYGCLYCLAMVHGNDVSGTIHSWCPAIPNYQGTCILVLHYRDVKMGAMVSQITSLMIVYPTVYLGVDQRKHQSSVSLTFVRGIHRWPVNSPHKWPVTRKMFPFDDVIVNFCNGTSYLHINICTYQYQWTATSSFVTVQMHSDVIKV